MPDAGSATSGSRCASSFRARVTSGSRPAPTSAGATAGCTKSVADYAPKQPFDLVFCHDVLQYLDDRTAARALSNLGRLSRGVLYFSVLTAGDWRRNADRARTDSGVHLRPAAWYRSRLLRHFRPVGGGMLVRRGFDPLLWELERPWPPV